MPEEIDNSSKKSFQEVASGISAELEKKGITRNGIATDGKKEGPEVTDDSSKDESPKEDTGTDKAPKKGTYEHRIHQLTARAKALEARAIAAESLVNSQKNDNSLQKEIDRLRAIIEKEDNSDDDDEPTHKKDGLSKQELQDLLDKRDADNEAKRKEEIVTMKQRELENEFGDFIKEDYKEYYDPALDALDDEAQEEVNELIELFRSNPQKWLERAMSAKGVKVLLSKPIIGSKPNEKTAQEIEDETKSLEMEKGTTVGNRSKSYEGKSFAEIAELKSAELAKRGIKRK